MPTKQEFINLVREEAISLTTVGSSGAATFNTSTGVFNIPQYSGGSGGGGIPVSFLNVQDFGATGDGSTDDYAAIQDCINTAVTTGVRWVFFPKTSFYYKITQPLIVIHGGTDSPSAGFVTLNLLGESTWWQSVSGTEIRCTFNDTFCIGIQRGKGCVVSNLKLTGTFSPPSSSNPYTYYNTAEADFVQDGSRDTPLSPYSGVVFDPFTASAAGADFYPGLTAFYGLGGGTSNGSTGCEVQDCFIDKFVIGVANSVNGELRNAELLKISRVYFGDFGCKWCVVGTQAQEKVNIIDYCASWGATYGFFANRGYGAAGGGSSEVGNWNISNINIAGGMIQCFNCIDTGNWFPFFVDKFYAENIGRIGVYSCFSGSMSNSIFDCRNPSEIGFQDILTCTNPNTLFSSVIIRVPYGNTGTPVIMMQNQAIFNNCTFSGVPYTPTSIIQYPTYINCIAGYGNETVKFGQTAPYIPVAKNMPFGDLVKYGNSIFYDQFSSVDVYERLSIVDANLTILFYLELPLTAITVASDHTFNFTVTYPEQYYVGCLVAVTSNGSANVGWAKVTGISGTTITCGYASVGVVTGSYYFIAIYPNLFSGTFTGDFVNNGEIENVQLDWGNSKASLVGTLFYEPYFSTIYPMKITAYNAGTNKFTVAKGSLTISDRADIYFSNNTRKEYLTNVDGAPSAATSRPALQKGTTYFNFKNTDKERTWKILTSGYKDGSPLATWVETTGY